MLFLDATSAKLYFTQNAYYVNISSIFMPFLARFYLHESVSDSDALIRCQVTAENSAPDLTQRIVKQLYHWPSEHKCHYIKIHDEFPPLKQAGNQN